MSTRFKIITRIGIPVGIVTGGVYIYKKFNFLVPVYDVPGDLKKYVFVITGADNGIGKATVEALAPTGARVVMACRNIDRCKEIRRPIVIASKNRNVVCRECDLSSFESVKKFAAKIIKEEPRIDVLINNAGVKYLPKRRTTRESIERQFGVNFVGHHLLTALLLDKLNESAPSRIVNVIGKAYTKGEIDFGNLNLDTKYKPAKAYDQSKLALALETKELARQLDPAKVTVNGVDPGYTNTDIERYTDSWFTLLRNTFYYVWRREPRQGAYPLLYASLSLEMQGVTGKFVNENLEAVDFNEKVTDDKILQRKIWLTGEKWARVEQAKKDVQALVASMPDKPPATTTTSSSEKEKSSSTSTTVTSSTGTTSTIIPSQTNSSMSSSGTSTISVSKSSDPLAMKT